MPRTLQEEHAVLDPRLVEGLTALVPTAWNEIILEVSRVRTSDGGETLTLSIQGPARSRQTVTPSERLIDCVRELSLVYAHRGMAWQSVRYHLVRAVPPAWDYRVDFTYPPDDTDAASKHAPNENKRRFVDTMFLYLSQAYPQEVTRLGADKTAEIIELGVTVAESYDVKIERDVGYYIDLMFALGFAFDDWKEMRWARKILRSRKLTGTEKMAQIRQRLEMD